jgi:hypothetical protein
MGNNNKDRSSKVQEQIWPKEKNIAPIEEEIATEAEPVESRDRDAERMDLHQFAVKFRKRIQGSLWNRVDKMSVGDLLRLSEIELEAEKRVEHKRPTELRVVWINKTTESTT